VLDRCAQQIRHQEGVARRHHLIGTHRHAVREYLRCLLRALPGGRRLVARTVEREILDQHVPSRSRTRRMKIGSMRRPPAANTEYADVISTSVTALAPSASDG
jgi:hypothetical protein